jgi:arginine decarboxylase
MRCRIVQFHYLVHSPADDAAVGHDDRAEGAPSLGYLARAEELMADAVVAEQAFFSTCGSSLSVKAAMLAVAGHRG